MIRITRLVPLLWILAAACVADSRAGSTLVLDSAGVRIVVSQVGSWGPDEAWTVDSQPRIQLGLHDRESEQFLGVRRVRLRSDESVVVLDGSSAEIRIFDPAGTLISVLGGEGDGPGELRGPRELHVVAADTILAWDNRPSVTRLAPDGSFVSRQAIDVARLRTFMPDGQTIGVRGLSDGSVLVVGYARPPREVTGRVRNRMLYGRAQIDGRAVDTLGWSLDREWWVTNSDAGSGRTLLGPESFWTAGGMPLRVGVAESVTSEVRLYSPTGTLQQIVRFPNVDRSLPRGAIQAAKDDRRNIPVQSASLERFLADAPEPAEAPSMGGLFLDGAGCLWILPYQPDEGAAAWNAAGLAQVFDPSGALLGSVKLPAGLVVHDVGPDWIAGVSRTDLGVEVVQVHDLRRRDDK